MFDPVPSWIHTGYAQRIHFGPASADRVGDIVKELGGRSVLLVTTAGRRESAAGQRVAASLRRALAATYDGVRPHVPTSAVQEALRMARANDVDTVVSLGGGSCADLAKAVCFFTEQQAGTPGTRYTDRPLVAHVAVPTTYSGAELTPFFGMTDEASRQKSGGGGPTTAPLAAVYDPMVTLDLPPRVSAETGMNALAHGVEAAWSTQRTPEAEAVALAAVERIAGALPDVVADPDSLEARSRMLAGAALGGRCLQNATMGVHHGLAQLLGGRTGIAHGLANAVLLAHCVRFNADAVPEEVRRIGAALGDPADAAGAVDRLRGRLGLPAGLSDCGVAEEDLAVVARMAPGSASVRANPRPVDEAGALAILEAAW